MRIPRLTAIQKHQTNVPTNDPETYFQVTVAIPTLDDLSNQLQTRFCDHKEVLSMAKSSLPVTTCTAERSFSNLRRLKSYLRNSCGQDRLTGLALIFVHREINIDMDEVINEIALRKGGN